MGTANKPMDLSFKKVQGLRSVVEKELLLLLQFILVVYIPSIDVLAHHNAVDANVPHLGGAMPPGFEFVINLLPFVGTFRRSTVLVNELPSFRISRCLRKQPGIVLTGNMKGTPVFSRRTRRCTGAYGSAFH